MLTPTITGIIDRRILINYSVDKAVLSKILPFPFRPKTVEGRGMVGVCLIRLKDIRPKGCPKIFGISSENGAHRMAVEWTQNGKQKEGVYIPRRDTSSRLNALAGGRVFPGVHHKSSFVVDEKSGSYSMDLTNKDGTSLIIKAKCLDGWHQDSVFKSLEDASDFFEKGSFGYSPSRDTLVFDGLELRTFCWKVSSLMVSEVHSSFFGDESVFPKGSIKFDNAILMENIKHEWRALPEIKKMAN